MYQKINLILSLVILFILNVSTLIFANNIEGKAIFLPNHQYKNVQHLYKVNGDVAEEFMSSYFKKSGWSQLEGEIGVNGIDGLFVKRDGNGKIKDVLFVESKFNKSKLGFSKALESRQMSQKVLERQVENLITDTKKRLSKSTSVTEKALLKKQLSEYKSIKQKIRTKAYRSRLFRMKPVGEGKFKITIDALESKGSKDVIKKSLQGVKKYKAHEVVVDLKKRYKIGSYEDRLQKQLKKSIQTTKNTHKIKRNYKKVSKLDKKLLNAVAVPAIIKKKGKKVLMFMDASVLRKSAKLKHLKFLKNVKGGDVVMVAFEGGIAVYSVMNGTMGFKQVSKILLKDKVDDIAGFSFSKGVAFFVPPPATIGVVVAIAGEILISYGIDKYEEIDKRKYVGLEDMLWDVPDEIKKKLIILNPEDMEGESVFDLDMIEKDTVFDDIVEGDSVFDIDQNDRETILD